jgi:predicted ATP-dependent protease
LRYYSDESPGIARMSRSDPFHTEEERRGFEYTVYVAAMQPNTTQKSLRLHTGLSDVCDDEIMKPSSQSLEELRAGNNSGTLHRHGRYSLDLRAGVNTLSCAGRIFNLEGCCCIERE